MKRLLFTALLFTSASLAASWDGTKGPDTLTTDGDATHTVLKISSTTPADLLIQVTVTYKPPSLQPTLDSVSRQVVARPYPNNPKLPPAEPGAVFVIFDVPQSQITGIQIAEAIVGEAQIFQ